MSKKKPLEIDMIAGSQLMDTQGEMLDVAGADISALTSGNGRLNDNHGIGFHNCVGTVTHAKKIFKLEDCVDDRQRYYWNKIKAPYIYVKGKLFDDDDHPNARAAAAILRNIHRNDVPLKIKASVEGGVISRGISDPSLLARTKIHSVALTFTPANNATLVEPISLDKSNYHAEADMELIKSVMYLAETNVPSFRHITRDAGASKIIKNIDKIHAIARQLGISEDKIPLPSKQELIKNAVEEKVYTNVHKIFTMVSTLRKEAALKMSPRPSIPEGVHDIEVHPMIDHLKRAKSMITDSGKPHMQVSDFKKAGLSSNVIDKLPRDGKGRVTAEGIDKHIDSLPKIKLQAQIAPYTMGQQLHHPKAKEHVVSVQIHPDSLKNMDPELKNHIMSITSKQHDFGLNTPNQIGWGRVDQKSGKDGHMHIGEIQSDFAHKDRIDKLLQKYSKDKNGLNKDTAAKVHAFLSHGHDDPQHLLHSAINELGRRHGIKSTSMNTPKDQVKQSGLNDKPPTVDGMPRRTKDGLIHPSDAKIGFDLAKFNKDTAAYSEKVFSSSNIKKLISKDKNPNLHSAIDKLGGIDGIKEEWERVDKKHYPMLDVYINLRERMPESKKLSEPQQDAIREFIKTHIHPNTADAESKDYHIHPKRAPDNTPDSDYVNLDTSKSALPVHQIDTYNKRPKKLGFQEVDKASLMPKHSEKGQKVQFSKLHKMTKALTAGYGGAGAPTDSVGGGVMQSEALDNKFKFISCNACGKEQIYHKYQTKCRECGKPFSLEKLEKLV